MKKYAVMTMDVEDWYDANYLLNLDLDKSYSMSDGLENYVQILEKHNIKGTFFTLSDMIKWVGPKLKVLKEKGHEIGVHGKNHIRPIEKDLITFEKEIKQAKELLEKEINGEVYGYRAPSYGIDIERLDIIEKLGFKYDSSKINSQSNSFYEQLDLSTFDIIDDKIYKRKDFIEFEISTEKLLNKRVTISGGGFFRIFPWFITKNLIKKFIKKENYFVFFIHPFEVSNKKTPKIKGLKILNKIRLNFGRKSVQRKINKLIKLLKKNNFEFVTFNEYVNIINK